MNGSDQKSWLRSVLSDRWIRLSELQQASGLKLDTLACYLDPREKFYVGDGIRVRVGEPRYWELELHLSSVNLFLERIRHRRQRLFGRHCPCEGCERMHRHIANEWPVW